MTDERIKEFMTQLGKPNSMQLYEVLKAVATEAKAEGVKEGKGEVAGE